MAGKQRVTIVGVGYSTVGRNTGLSLDTLTAQASVAVMADAGVTPKDIDGIAVHSFPHQYVSATHTAAMLGLPDLGFYSGSVDGAAYAVAAMHGIAAVASGSSEMCLTLRTVHRSGAAGGTALLGGDGSGGVGGNFQFSMPYGSFTGSHFAGLYMQWHMAQYGTKEEDFGAFAVAQREYAVKNPTESFFHEPLTIEEYMNSRYIAKPLHLLDCDYPVDSSSALIFTTEERARDLRQKPVFFDSWASGTTAEADFSLVEDVTRSSDPDPNRSHPTRAWVRCRRPLPAEPNLQICALVYASDLFSGLPDVIHIDGETAMASLDHAVWIHRPPRCDDWLLIDHHGVSVASHRGWYSSYAFNRDGVLVASIAREMVIR